MRRLPSLFSAISFFCSFFLPLILKIDLATWQSFLGILSFMIVFFIMFHMRNLTRVFLLQIFTCWIKTRRPLDCVSITLVSMLS